MSDSPPTDPSAPLPPRIWGVFGVLLGGLLFCRAPDALLRPQWYAEDAIIFFHQAYWLGPQSLVQPYEGYLHLVPRLVAWLVVDLPFLWQPAIYVGAAFFGAWALFLAIATSRVGGRQGWGLAFAILAALTPQPSCEIFWSLTNFQWVCAIYLMHGLVADVPQGGRALCLHGFLTAVCALTSPFCLILSPLIAARALLERKRARFVLAGVFLAASAVQGWYVFQYPSAVRSSLPPLGLTLEVVGFRVVAQGFIPAVGNWQDMAAQAALGLGVVAFGVLAWVSVRSWRSGPATWAFGAVFTLFSVAALTRVRLEDRHLLLEPPFGAWGDRYFFLLRIALGGAILLGCWPRQGPRRLALGLLSLWVLVVGLPQAPRERLDVYPWSEYAGRMQAGEPVKIYFPPGWSYEFRPRPQGR